MYILFTGFSPEEQEIILSWSKNISSEFSEGFSVGDSLQIGRLVEVSSQFLSETNMKLPDLIERAREYRENFEDYLSYITETRFFYNKKLDCIFTTNIKETDIGLSVKIIKIPFSIFFKMADNGLLKAYLGVEEENKIVPDNEIELVETGFLNRYLVCNYIDDNTVFLIEGSDFQEFQKVCQFITKLGKKIGWEWYKDPDSGIKEED